MSKDSLNDNKDNKRNNKKDKKSKNHQFIRGLSYLSQMGLTIIASVLIGVFLGKFLDKILGTTPWFLLFFSLVGVGAAIRNIFIMSKDK